MKIKNVFLLLSIISGVIGLTGGFGNDMVDGFAKAFAGVFFIMFYIFHVFAGPQMGVDAAAKGKH